MSAFWIVRLGSAGLIFFALKAAWHWQASALILTRADIAGVLDARSAMGVVAESALEQARQNARGSRSAALAGVLAAAVAFVLAQDRIIMEMSRSAGDYAAASPFHRVVTGDNPVSDDVISYIEHNPVKPAPIGDMAVGALIPEDIGVTPVPSEPGYAYIYVDGAPVLIDVRTRRVAWIP